MGLADSFLARQAFETPASPLTALVYDEGFPIGALFAQLAARAQKAGLRLGGALERPGPAKGEGRPCDMALEDLASGRKIQISEDRGVFARGCRLDHDALTRVCALVLSSLPSRDLVLLNKFGKTEAEGGGFRCVISDALALEIPLIIGAPRHNLAAWRAFAGEIATEREAAAYDSGGLFRVS